METQVRFSRSSKPFTPSSPIPFSGKFFRQTSSLAQYGHVEVILEPLPSADDPCLFCWEIGESVIPGEFRNAVLDGMMEALEADDSPYDSLRATRIRVVGGSCNEVDASYRAYVSAARVGMREALQRVSADRPPP